MLVNAEAITSVDSTAAQGLEELLETLDGMGVRLAFARVKAPLRARLDRASITDRIGADHIYLEVDDGVDALLGSSGPDDGGLSTTTLESGVTASDT